MVILGYVLLFIYVSVMSLVTIFCLMQFHLLWHFLTRKKTKLKEDGMEDYPLVTIQLPIFNEMYVVQRLIDNIVEMDYPKDKIEIQVLDDSTDDTLAISKERVDFYKAKGFNISLHARTDRTGYKAGALKAATKVAQGDFIAIFDADFLPKKDFLKKAIPFFNDPKIGVVQTRWGHINEDYSILTRLQAFQLNVHFTIEQCGRENGNFLLQFNGTAGIWRRDCIEEAGGWEADTLTEDLDLSYRAQIKGWKIRYLENVISPAELPAEMGGLKSQQFRWMKGGAETARKLLPTVWHANIPFMQKIHGSIHLLSSSIFLFVYLLGFLSVPLLFFVRPLNIPIHYLSTFMVSTLAIISVYFVANVFNDIEDGSKIKLTLKFLLLFPMFLALSMGLSLHNSFAVIQGYMGKKSAFIRTPKFNVKGVGDRIKMKNYLTLKFSPMTIMEGLMFLFFLWAVYYAVKSGNRAFMIFHMLLAFGYGSIFLISVKHLALKK